MKFQRRSNRSGISLFAVGLVVVLAAVLFVSFRNPSAANEIYVDSAAAVPTSDFLDSIGVVSTFPDRGQPVERTIEMLRYGGFRWVRAGIEGLSEDGPTTIETFLTLHRETGVLLNWGLVSGGSDLRKLIENGRILAEAGALLAFEGNNEPNNWAVTYGGETGGGRDHSWLPVARLQRDLYEAVKSDPVLAKYPVWSISEPGAQKDNVGLQFLTIPPDADTLMPAGTKYADYANVHNYVYHPNSPHPLDNKVWNASDPSAASMVDGLYGNYGRTWRKGFRGYSQEELNKLPRVTTETGARIGGQVTEELHGLNLMTLYLAQFKRGYSYTSVYLLRDRTDEGGNQAFGFFKRDYSPRKAAIYLHNLTTILADRDRIDAPGQLDFKILNRPNTVHDLLLQKSDGTFQLVVWGERVEGADEVTINLDQKAASITFFDPTIGSEPIRKAVDQDSISLTLSNHPVVLEIANESK